MPQQTDMTAEALARGAAPGRGYMLGRVLSQILHPLTLAVATIFIVGTFDAETQGRGIYWSLVCLLVQVLPPTLFFLVRLRQGAYSDEDVSVRSQRNELYLFGMISIIVGFAVLWLLGAPRPFLVLLFTVALVNLLGFVVNLYWKISVHASSIAMTATVAALYSTRIGLVLWLAAIAVGWARVRTRNHTPMQVIAGTVLATIATLAVFYTLR